MNNCLPAERMAHLEEENKKVTRLLLKKPKNPLTLQYNRRCCCVLYPPGQSAEQAIDMNELLV
jgi:hypothetical protein